MRILFVNYEYPPVGGGGGVGCKILVDELAKNQDIDVLTSGFKNLPSIKKQGKATIYRVPALFRKTFETSNIFSLLSYLALSLFVGLVLVKRKRYDVIHSFFVLPSGMVGLVLSKLYSRPHVLTIIGGDIYDPTKRLTPEKNLLIRFLTKKIINNSDFVSAISSDVTLRAKNICHLRQDKKIKTISLGFRPFPLKAKLGRSRYDNKFRLITLARLVKRKGINYLIEALSILKNKNVHLWVCGDGPEKRNLMKVARKLDVGLQVEFLGSVSEKEKYDYLQSSDCFISGSLHEGLGLVFFEAMYSGLPIVATNVGGQKDILENGKTGYLVPTKNSKVLADRILRLMKNKTLRKKISNYNRQRVKKFYIADIVKNYKNIYENISKKEEVGKESFSEIQRKYYSLHADEFDERGLYSRDNRNHIKKIRKIISVAYETNPRKVLEVGTGTGIHAKRFLENLKKDIDFTGVDISREMLKIARKRLKPFIEKQRARLITAEMSSLPFTDNSFDLVFCAATLYHVDDQEKGVKEMTRVLKKGGKLILVEPNWLFPTNIWAGVSNPVERNVFNMRKSNFQKWTKNILKRVEINNFLYTPPYPVFLSNVYDLIDEIFPRIPLLNNLSIMIFVVGEK